MTKNQPFNSFNSMFEAFQPALASAGVQPEANWTSTKVKIARLTRAQLRRGNLKPATVAKWHRLGSIVGA